MTARERALAEKAAGEARGEARGEGRGGGWAGVSGTVVLGFGLRAADWDEREERIIALGFQLIAQKSCRALSEAGTGFMK